ncbi:E3 ubiquitin- ligase CIP8 [Olea europaea subsp. europaea]|uniref:RING-type E3 ubiquitin transferase n=1 Tax=Olea europaea subsp. europaea TaxID=158383 RepID=A0A8S0TN66_OLEEU|nr:E3 ubiquitin- ligase CIP8 [Olea europaea subsp. europaea]
MAEAQSDQSSTTQTPASSGSDPDILQYWCYHCDKRVSIETLADLPDVICYECKSGFVESISATTVPSPGDAPSRAGSDPIDDPGFGNQFIHVLRLIAEAAREEDAPPPPPSEHADLSDDDFLRIELDGWVDDEDDEEEHSVEGHEDENHEVENENENLDQSDGEHGEVNAVNENQSEDEEEETRRRRRDVLRLRLRDFAARAASRRNRILDWAEILMGLEDHSIELRLQVPESDTFFGNPGDYVDAAGYEALLHNLAESDAGGRPGAPPASKATVEGLENLLIKKEEETLVCAICKDSVNVGEMARKLPCGHGYHGDCIVPWLWSRNTCPVCRFELPTDDPDYEEERKKRVVVASLRAPSSSSSGGAGSYNSGFD